MLTGGRQILDLSRGPLVMGIINVNEDSFYAPSRVNSDSALLNRVEDMLASGVDLIDVGAMSSRPGASLSDPDEESKTIFHSLKLIRNSFPEVFISIDTVWSAVAKVAAEEGANMINDISAGKIDQNLWAVVAHHNLSYVLMHMKGNPQNMQNLTHYDDLMMELMVFFTENIRKLHQHGIAQIILDPGFGFSKSGNQNFSLLKNLSAFQIFDLPVLAGISRKSFIYKALNTSQENVISATSALHSICLEQGVNILRVHDVLEAKQVVSLFQLLKKG